jgi:hypothetical protein
MFLKKNSMSLPQKIQNEIKELAEKFDAFAQEVLVTNFNDLDLYILKCHLIMEHELNKFIEVSTRQRLTMEVANFTFSQKIKIATLLGAFDDEDAKSISSFLKEINKLRNHIAHKLTFDRDHLNKITDFDTNYSDEKFGSAEIFYKKVLMDLVGFNSGALHYIAKMIPLRASLELLTRAVSDSDA